MEDVLEGDLVEADLEQVLRVARRERDEYLDMVRRVQADFENYKKRMLRQQTDLLERAAQGLIDKLLPALDAFDLARTHLSDVQQLSDEGKALLQASALLFDTLAKEGLELVDDVGKPFDPTTHDAVEREKAEEPESGPTDAAEDGPAGMSGDRSPERTPHDAVETGAHDVDGPVVTAVLRPGYRWKGRVIRPALVRVRG